MMLEMLISLTLLLMLAIFLLPHTVIVIQDRKNMRLSQTASIFLREQAVSYQFGGQPPISVVQDIEGTLYTSAWKKAADAYQICVNWKDARNQQQGKCRYVAK